MKKLLFLLAFALAGCQSAPPDWLYPNQKSAEAKMQEMTKKQAAELIYRSYKLAQAAMKVYAAYPACAPEAGIVLYCKDDAQWKRIGDADKIAVAAVIAAANDATEEKQKQAIDAIDALTEIINETAVKIKGS